MTLGAGTKTAITTTDAVLPKQYPLKAGWLAYRMRWKRRRMLWRAFRSRRDLNALSLKTDSIQAHDVLVFCTMRNEMARLPHFLSHYRALGVAHFIFVDNASTDGSAELVAEQADCSVWRTDASYKASRFGLDWINHLLGRFGHNHWCLTVDVDELLTYSRWNRVELPGLTSWLDKTNTFCFGALMLDMYPKGPIGEEFSDTDPIAYLDHFDAGPYRAQRQPLIQNLWVQGGARERFFFDKTPHLSPTLNKIPLVKWHRSYAYMNSTHSMLPRHMNAALIDMAGTHIPSGALLHTKFLPTIIEKSAEEKQRKEHFTNSANFDAYYNAIIENPTLWHANSVRYTGAEQLEALGLIQDGGWS